MHTTTIKVEPGSHEIRMVTEFDAPPELVYASYVDPEAIPRWWGPSYLSTRVDRLEGRPGGSWRFVQRDAEGKEYAFHGVFHQAEAGRRLVYTFEFEGAAGHVALETIDFEPRAGGGCKLVDGMVFQSVADRDAMAASGMESGARESMERLAELLAPPADGRP
jgi:uncharacterized protein YndB with AHSA1/START domain